VIVSEKKPGKLGFFYLWDVTECYRLSPEVGTFLEHFFGTFPGTLAWAHPTGGIAPKDFYLSTAEK
jgi:hypothetical protein